jgi:hypothetical protein
LSGACNSFGYGGVHRPGKTEARLQTLRFDAHHEDLLREVAKHCCCRQQFAGVSLVSGCGVEGAQLLHLPCVEGRHGARLLAELKGIKDDERLPSGEAAEQIQPLCAAVKKLNVATLIAALPAQFLQNRRANAVVAEQEIAET